MAEPEKKKFPRIPKLDFTRWRAARKAEAKKALVQKAAEAIANDEIGYAMPDGTIYGGISLDTHKPMFVTAEYSILGRDFNRAAEYAKNLDMHGHKDWRMPTKAELDVLFQNREKGALHGTFNTTVRHRDSRYWSSTFSSENTTWAQWTQNSAWTQSFSDGNQAVASMHSIFSVRCVR